MSQLRFELSSLFITHITASCRALPVAARPAPRTRERARVPSGHVLAARAARHVARAVLRGRGHGDGDAGGADLALDPGVDPLLGPGDLLPQVAEPGLTVPVRRPATPGS